MVVTLDDTKRDAIAAKLSDIKLIQQLLIENEEVFLRESTDSEISNIIHRMRDDDRKNLDILDTVIVQYGIQREAESTIQELVRKVRQLIQGDELSFYEKVFQHELLKHQQVMNGLTVHKAAQKVGADIMAAITPLNTINFENRAHQEQLKGILEILGVRELTGLDADQGIWARVQDAIAAISGVLGSAVTHTSDQQDVSIQDILRMDHQKVNTLFTELLNSNNPQKVQEFFGQLYRDLNTHAVAEEEVVYPKVRPFYGEANTQELYDEQTHWKVLLEQLKAMNPAATEFKNTIRQLRDEVADHVRQEESTMFTEIHSNMTSRETEELATQFKTAKSRIQQEMARNKAQVNA